MDRIATARNVDAARNSDRAKAIAKAKDFVKSKDDLLTKTIAKKRGHRDVQARTSIIKSSLALGL